MKIGKMFFVSMFSVGVLGTVLAGQVLVASFLEAANRRVAAHAVDTSSALLKAINLLSVERAPTLVALSQESAASPPLATAIAAARGASDAMVDTVIAGVKDLPDGDRTEKDISRLVAAVAAARAGVDRELAVPSRERNAAQVAQYLPTMNSSVTAFDPILSRLASLAASGDSEILILLQFARSVQDLRLILGNRAALLTVPLGVGRPLTSAELTTADQLDGRAIAERRRIELLLGQVGGAPNVAAAWTAAAGAFGEIEPVLRREVENSRTGKPYGITGADLSRTAPATLGRALQARDAALDEATSLARKEGDAAVMTLLLSGGVGAALLGLLVTVTMLLRRLVVRPLERLTHVVAAIARGDYRLTVEGTDRKNEIGQMAVAVETLRVNAIAAAELSLESERARADREARATHIEALTRRFDEASRALVDTVRSGATQMRAQASASAQSASSASMTCSEVQHASNAALLNVQTVATAAEELSASIGEIASQVGNSSRVAAEAVDAATKANERVSGLADASERIGQVVRLISEIAAQTNLLALNAAIEAARAGEAGKGFAVVAAEVKALAGQTAKATDDIAAQVAAIQAEAGEAVASIRGISLTIGDVNAITSGISAAVEQQNAATAEIARNVNEAARGTRDVLGRIDAVGQAINHSEASVEDLQAALSGLSDHADALTQEIARYLEAVRAA